MIYGYCRVSSDEQAAHGISIEAQRDILNGYAAMSQSEIRIFEDAGFSGKNTDRPALQKLLAAVRSGGVSSVVVWKLDRLSRSLRDTLSMIEDVLAPAGVTLVSVTESIDTSTPSGRMMLNLLASFAQLEREQDSDRVVMAHKHLARDCKYLGGHIPLGYLVDDEKHYQLHPDLAPVVRRVFEMYLSREGYTPILEYLNSSAVFPLTGKKKEFSKQDLYFLLQNEIYTGTYVRKIGADPRHKVTSPETVRVPGGVPAIITPDEWHRVCAIRRQNATFAASYRAVNLYPLSGLVRCSVCGRTMSVRHGGKTRSGEIERYYKCSSSCVRPARVESVEDAAYTAISYFLRDDETIRRACSIANSYGEQVAADNLSSISQLETRLLQIGKENARLISYIKTHESAPSSIMQSLLALEEEEKDLRQRIETLRRPRGKYDAEKFKHLLLEAADIKKQPPDIRKARCQAAIHGVEISDTSYRVLFRCPTSSGDEPPQYVQHTVKRK